MNTPFGGTKYGFALVFTKGQAKRNNIRRVRNPAAAAPKIKSVLAGGLVHPSGFVRPISEMTWARIERIFRSGGNCNPTVVDTSVTLGKTCHPCPRADLKWSENDTDMAGAWSVVSSDSFTIRNLNVAAASLDVTGITIIHLTLFVDAGKLPGLTKNASFVSHSSKFGKAGDCNTKLIAGFGFGFSTMGLLDELSISTYR